MARDFDRQVVEIQVRIAVLNGYTAITIPVTEAVGLLRPGKGETRPSPDLCNRAFHWRQIPALRPARASERGRMFHAKVALGMDDDGLHASGSLIRFRSVSPRASRLMFSATVAVRREIVPSVHPDI